MIRGILSHPLRPGGPLQTYLRILFCALFAMPGLGCAGAEFDLVNALRAQAGLPRLAPEAALAAAAELHAAYLDRHREPGQTGQGLSAHQQ